MTSAFEHLSPAFPGRAAWGTASRLRAWQAAALQQYLDAGPRDFLAVATPGAGKTTFALRLASDLLHQRTIERVIIVAPTEHLKVQWAEAAARVGIHIDPGLGSSRHARSREYDGVAVTYAGVAARVHHYEARTVRHKTLVILDEVHHAGDALSWGEAVRDAFALATRRLALTGTPFRSDDNPIPFIHYEPTPDGGRRSVADYTYGYADALRDSVVRPVVFMTYGGQMRWRTKAGEVLDASLGALLTKDVTAQAWRTALDPAGEWIGAVLASADKRLTQVRRHVPDAGGLVIATNQTHARAYARLLESITGERPALVVSDDAGASARIEQFAASEERWMVAVRMVSEGVDVPRLAVGVYATATSTSLFFAQAVGRFVRSRRRGELATVFVPTVPHLLAHASSLEQQRDHVLGGRRPVEDGLLDDDLLAAAQRTETEPDLAESTWEALASDATFDHVLHDGQQFGLTALPHSDEEHDYLGLPGLLEPDQVGTLLRERQRRHLQRAARRDRKQARAAGTSFDEVSLHRTLATQRKELNALVSQYARLRGVPHSHVHAGLRRECGGPALAQASSDQVSARIDVVREWLQR